MFLTIALCRYIDVDLQASSKWYYIGRYVFNGKDSEGRMSYNLSGLTKNSVLVMYSESNVNWPDIWANKDNCAYVIGNKQASKTLSKESAIVLIEKTPSPTFWHLAIASCDAKARINGTIHLEDMDYDNGVKSYNKEFDFSQQEETETTAIFALLFGALFMQQLFNFFMKMRPERHMFVKLITLSTGLICLGYLLNLIYCTQHSQTGRSSFWKGFADLVIMCGDMLLLLVSLLIGQGYLISHPLLQHKLITLILFAVTVIIAIVMLIFTIVVSDDPIAAFNMETIPGILYLICRLICAAFFAYAIFVNRRKETYSERKALYTVLFIIFFCQLAGPTITFFFCFALPKWFRETNFLLITRMLDFVAVVVIVYLTEPTQIEDHFRVRGIVNVEPKVGGLIKGEDSDDAPVKASSVEDVKIKLPGSQ